MCHPLPLTGSSAGGPDRAALISGLPATVKATAAALLALTATPATLPVTAARWDEELPPQAAAAASASQRENFIGCANYDTLSRNGSAA